MESVEALERALKEAGISDKELSTWHEPNRTLEDLFEEIQKGECVLDLVNLTRTIVSLSIDVYALYKGFYYRLCESKQVKRNGTVVVRKRKKAAVSERLLPGEEPNEFSVRRALREELGVPGFRKLVFLKVTEQVHGGGYPGLTTHNTLHHFKLSLLDTDFNPNGYTEHLVDRIIYFTWKLWGKAEVRQVA